MNKVAVFIDAEYVIQSIRALRGKPSDLRIGIDNIHWKNIVDFVVKGQTLISVYYYTAQLDPEENPKTFEHQQHYLQSIQHDIGVNITKLRLQKMIKIKNKTGSTWDENRKTSKNAPHSWVQKGCDTKIVLDILKGAFSNEYDTCILIAGDSDFTEVLETIKMEYNKICELITFDRYDSKLQEDLPKAASLHTIIDYKTGCNHNFWTPYTHYKNNTNKQFNKTNDNDTMYRPFVDLLIKQRIKPTE